MRITDVEMACGTCGKVTRVGDCEPDVDGDGSLGCPVPDCGGIMLATRSEHYAEAIAKAKAGGQS